MFQTLKLKVVPFMLSKLGFLYHLGTRCLVVISLSLWGLEQPYTTFSFWSSHLCIPGLWGSPFLLTIWALYVLEEFWSMIVICKCLIKNHLTSKFFIFQLRVLYKNVILKLFNSEANTVAKIVTCNFEIMFKKVAHVTVHISWLCCLFDHPNMQNVLLWEYMCMP